MFRMKFRGRCSLNLAPQVGAHFWNFQDEAAAHEVKGNNRDVEVSALGGTQ